MKLKLVIGILGLSLVGNAFALTFDESLKQTNQEIVKTSEQLQAAPAEVKKGFFASVKEARHDYKAWKKENPEALEEFKLAQASIKQDLENPGSDLSLAMMSAKAQCAELKTESPSASCREIYSETVEPLYKAKFSKLAEYRHEKAPEIEMAQTCEAGNFNQDKIPFHALLFGHHQFRCGLHNQKVTLTVYGPGLAIGTASAAFIACANGLQGTNVGIYAGVSVFFGINLGTFVGSGGVCSILGGEILSVGAAAGVGILKFPETYKVTPQKTSNNF